jgi:hypothetical protein
MTSSILFFQISDVEGSELSVTVYHEGSDGHQIEYVEVSTNNRVVNCPINKKLDGTDYFTARCY